MSHHVAFKTTDDDALAAATLKTCIFRSIIALSTTRLEPTSFKPSSG